MPADDLPSPDRPRPQGGRGSPEPDAPDAPGVADAAEPGNWQGSQDGSGLFGGYGSPPVPAAGPSKPADAGPDEAGSGETGPG